MELLRSACHDAAWAPGDVMLSLPNPSAPFKKNKSTDCVAISPACLTSQKRTFATCLSRLFAAVSAHSKKWPLLWLFKKKRCKAFWPDVELSDTFDQEHAGGFQFFISGHSPVNRANPACELS